MKSFTDNTGKSWLINVNVGTIKRVRALCNVDLANIISIENGTAPKVDLLEKLANDPVLLVDVLYAICKDDADKIGVSDEDFGRAMAGDAIEHATTALLDEVIDFFPEVKRQVFQKILNATRRFQNKGKLALQEFLDNPKFDQEMDNELEILMNSSVISQE